MHVTVLQKRPCVNKYLYYGIIFLAVLVYQVESSPTYKASAQNSDDTPPQVVGTVERPRADAEASVTNNNQNPPTDKVSKADWVQIMVSAFAALVILWQAWIYNQQKKQTRIAERGYIGIKHVDLIDFEPDKIPIIQVNFLNGGRTPVWNLYTPGGFTLDKEPPDDWEPTASPDEAGAFLVAGETGKVRWVFPIPMNAATIKEVVDGRLYLYLKGKAIFEDCWGEKRTYPFYLVYHPKTGGFQEHKRYSQYMEYQLEKEGTKERKRV